MLAQAGIQGSEGMDTGLRGTTDAAYTYLSGRLYRHIYFLRDTKITKFGEK